ncbi:MAG: hypothetical protein DA408_04070 [Bacteroidetes bacterium]|nr:MAG: hypothetical protein C7N36_05975 [Bacteroidota bacterium]PTM14074.1 MAG: hypothetical protein DA408_04070 [Bacteroidota bacterium]
MLLISFYWLGLPYTFGDEAFLIKWTALTKKSLFGIDPKPSPESVLFVDLSESKTTESIPNEFGEINDYHRIITTDRQQLASFLEMIVPYRDDVRLVVLDVLLDKPSPGDSILQRTVEKLGDKILGINQLNNEGGIDSTAIHFPNQALANYRSAQGLFLKYPLLLKGHFPTVPLAMYQ